MDVARSTAAQSLYTIVQANWRDLGSLRSLEQASFPKDAWSLFDLVGVLTFPNVVRLKAIFDGRLVGFIAADVRRQQHLAWIATIAVLPEHRRKGIGAALLQACEARLDAPRIRLCVRASNHTALSLYQRFQYRRVNLWSAYYQDGEDAIVMEKERLGVESGL